MEEGEEALGSSANYWLNGSGRYMARPHRPHDSEPAHVDTAARCIAEMEDIEREANAKACFVAAYRAAKIKAGLAAPLGRSPLIGPRAPAA
jgi:hypothetical protein